MRNIMFLILLSLIIAGCAGFQSDGLTPITLAYQDKTTDPKKIWADSKLKEAFSKYWSLRFSDRPIKEILLNEAPHIQEMVDENRYSIYMRGPLRSDLLEIRIMGITHETENFCWINAVVFLKAPNMQKPKDVNIKDGWVKVRGKWYHIIKDPLFFPGI